MHEIRCPSCRLRLWLYQGMDRDIPAPELCPACSGPADHADVLAARLAARIARDHRAQRAMLAEREHDDVFARRPAGPRASR